MNTLTVIAALLGAVYVSGQHLSGNVDDYAECIERWLASKPDMRDRFDRRQIAWLCERTQMWQRRAESKPDVNNDDILTTNQRRWLFNLRTCQGHDCIQNVIQQRCKGQRCRGPPSDRDTSDPPKTTTLRPIMSNDASKSDELERDFLSFNANNLDFDETILFAPDDQEGPDNQTVEGGHGTTCQLKTKIGRLCPAALNGTIAETVLPKIIASLRSNLTGAALDDQLEKVNELSTKLSTKCESVQANLLRRSLTFDYFLNECSENEIRSRRSGMATECLRVLKAKTAEEALPELSRRLRGRTENSNLHARFEKLIEQKYEKWFNRCLSVQEELTALGNSFSSWLGASNAMRRKRADETPLEFDDDMVLELGDTDFRAHRKEIRQMSDNERQKFFAALNRLKKEKIDGTSMYDLLVIYHTPEESPGAHWGPAFLPFHREWIKQLEVALRQLDPDVAVPYWDSTLDEGLPTPKDAILWTDDFFGGNNGNVISGPFANWVTTHELGFVPNVKTLYRDVGTSPFGGLFKEADIEFAMSREQFEDFTACVDPTFELVHGVVHMFVGGYMADIAISPNDPTFFMHHCFIDFIWEQWRQSKQTLERREKDYPADDRSCNDFHYGSHLMQPFAVKNIDGLLNNYTRDFYYYSPRSQCNNTNPDCGSPYIFCDTKKYRCLSKVQMGGNCTGFEGTNICLGGICANGKCIDQDNGEPTTVPITTTTTTTASTTTTTLTPSTTLPSSTFTTPTTTITTTSPLATTAIPTASSTPTITTTIINQPPTPNPDELTTPSPPWSSTNGTVPITPTTPSLTTQTFTSTSTTTVIATEQSTSSAFTTTTTTTPPPDTTTTTIPQTTPSDPSTTVSTTIGVITTPLLTPTPTTSAPHTSTTPFSSAQFTTTLRTPMPSTQQPPQTTMVQTTSQPAHQPTGGGYNPPNGGSYASSVINWEEQPPFPVVYFTISVVQGDFQNVRQEARRGAPNCQITVSGLNIPSGYTQSMSGLSYTSSAYPEYLSGAVVRAMDPAKAGYFPLVEVDVSVVNSMGAPCSRFCYDGKQYQPCDSKRVKLSTNSEYSDPVVFRKTEELAQTAQWAGRGYYRTRKEDYLLFQCPTVYG
uniref:Tyrosinase copper-binding domain-containing protein n=1 Tax=Plectus sambesii TaxID=2011161 RepID=A0A914VW86_9BILA